MENPIVTDTKRNAHIFCVHDLIEMASWYVGELKDSQMHKEELTYLEEKFSDFFTFLEEKMPDKAYHEPILLSHFEFEKVIQAQKKHVLCRECRNLAKTLAVKFPAELEADRR